MKTFSKNILQKTKRQPTGFSEIIIKSSQFRFKEFRKKSTCILNKPEYFSLIKQATERVYLLNGINYHCSYVSGN
jgi:hypothetical protein